MAVKIIHAKQALTDAQADELGGTMLGNSSYDTLITEDADVLKPDGSVLIKFRKRAIPAALCRVSYPVFRQAATPSDNRGMAAGVIKNPEKLHEVPGKVGRTRFQTLKQDGTLSNTSRSKEVLSGIVGYFDKNPRFPYCRLTAYNLAHGDRFAKTLPFIRHVDGLFKELMPERYQAQIAVVEKTNPDFYIHNTSFTTITVNKNFQTAVHKDAGDLKEGFGVMACLRAGHYRGCFLCFPKYRIAVDSGTGDLLLADVHEWHGNTPLRGIPGNYERISLVFYYREGMKNCGSATEELERAKKQRGAL